MLLEEAGQDRAAPGRTGGGLDRNQLVDQLEKTLRGNGRAVGDDRHLPGPGQDGQDLDGGHMGPGIDDDRIGQLGRIGQGGQGCRGGDDDGLCSCQNAGMCLLEGGQGCTGVPGQHGMELVGLLGAGEEQLRKTLLALLGHHGSNTGHVLCINLVETLGGIGQGRAILVGDDLGGVHDVIEDRGPPGQPQLSSDGLALHLPGAEVLNKIIQPNSLELPFQGATLRQGIQGQVVIKEGLEPLLHLVEFHDFQVAAAGRGGQDRIQGRHVLDQGILGVDYRIQLGRKNGPAAMGNKGAPLVGLLGHHLKCRMQVFGLGTRPEQALGLLDQSTAFPEAKIGSVGLSVGLGLGGLDHGRNITLENGWLEHVEDPAQVLQDNHLLPPVTNSGRHRETAGLHGGLDLLTGGGQKPLKEADDPGIGVHGLILAGQGGPEPGGVVGPDGEFTQLSRTLQLLGPDIHLRLEGVGRSRTQADPGHRMGGKVGNLGKVLDGLVGRDSPTRVHTVQVAQVPGEPGTHAHQLVGHLVEVFGRLTGLEAHSINQTSIQGLTELTVGHIKDHISHAVGLKPVLEPTLLLNHTGHVENRPPRRDTAGCDGQGIFRALPTGLFIQEDAVARANQLGGIPDLVINVSGLEFTVRVGIERTVLRYGLAPEPGRGLLVSCHGIQQIIAGRPGLHPVQDGQALPQQLGGGLDVASKNDFPFNRKVVDLGGNQLGHVLEEGRGLWGATFVVRGGEEPGGVQIDPPLPHGGDKDRIQVDLPREADGGPGCPFPSFLDADWVEKDRHGLALPGRHTHHQGELGATA